MLTILSTIITAAAPVIMDKTSTSSQSTPDQRSKYGMKGPKGFVPRNRLESDSDSDSGSGSSGSDTDIDGINDDDTKSVTPPSSPRKESSKHMAVKQTPMKPSTESSNDNEKHKKTPVDHGDGSKSSKSDKKKAEESSSSTSKKSSSTDGKKKKDTDDTTSKSDSTSSKPEGGTKSLATSTTINIPEVFSGSDKDVENGTNVKIKHIGGKIYETTKKQEAQKETYIIFKTRKGMSKASKESLMGVGAIERFKDLLPGYLEIIREIAVEEPDNDMYTNDQITNAQTGVKLVKELIKDPSLYKKYVRWYEEKYKSKDTSTSGEKKKQKKSDDTTTSTTNGSTSKKRSRDDGPPSTIAPSKGRRSVDYEDEDQSTSKKQKLDVASIISETKKNVEGAIRASKLAASGGASMMFQLTEQSLMRLFIENQMHRTISFYATLAEAETIEDLKELKKETGL